MAATLIIGHLHNDMTSIVIATDGSIPFIAHLGAALGDVDIDSVLLSRGIAGGGLDIEVRTTMFPQSSSGWMGRPGIEAHRPDGSPVPFRFLMHRSHRTDDRIAMELLDEENAAELNIDVQLLPSGIIEVLSSITNRGDSPLILTALRLTFPVGDNAGEVLTLGGRHAMEAIEERTTWARSVVSVENRSGRTSHQNLGFLCTGTPSFSEHEGELWAAHIAWSGNFEIVCDGVSNSTRSMQIGELLSPGEIVLSTHHTHVAPLIDISYSSRGLLNMSRQFHREMRALQRPHISRPVILNTWEAVYFDHDLPTLTALADTAADVGIERFVLDDGWFHARRSDTAGLGDWWVDTSVWPHGLTPLISHVRSRGMEFGLWFEPEMVNPDSDLFRAHPHWALDGMRDDAVLGRHQLVLDMSLPDVRDYLFQHIDHMLSHHEIAYVKWDHNRPLIGARSVAQTRGTYELLQRLIVAHPMVQFESCASGGGRIDFGIARFVQRFWASDSIDALDRLAIQRGLSFFMPPEVLGSHIGSPTCHTTGRKHALSFRAATAMFGWLGVEWNLLTLTPKERLNLTDAIAVYKKFRPLLHSGDVFRNNHPDPNIHVHGVIATNFSEALISVSRLRNGPNHHTSPLRVVGLAPDAVYTLSTVPLGSSRYALHRELPAWITHGVTMSGRQLQHLGVALPSLLPESTILVHVQELRQ